MNPNLKIPPERLRSFYLKHGIKKLAVFGSALGNAFGPESDIDLLVEFEPDRIPTLFDMTEIEQELSIICGGRKIDLRTPEDLSRYFRNRVLKEAEVQYAG